MKLISLNIWGGHEFDALISFIKSQAEDTDIFCFQEALSYSEPVTKRGARLNIFEELEKVLPDHQGLFTPVQEGLGVDGKRDIESTFGQAFFVKKDISVEENGFTFLRGRRNGMQGEDITTLGWGFQYLRIMRNGMPLTVVGVHGIVQLVDGVDTKLDTPDRLTQSEKLKEFLDTIDGQKILCGDFNLMPQTKSITMLEGNMKNLIKDFKITDTRGEIDRKKYPNDHTQQYFADYCFVSPDINVNSFQVPEVPVSDHLPLILEFS